MSRYGNHIPGHHVLRGTVAALLLVLASGALANPPLRPQALHVLPGDAALVAAAGDQTTPYIAAGGDGFLAVWTDDRSTVPEDGGEVGTGRDIYAARLDADGGLIDTTPFAVTRETGDQYDPRAVWNGQAWLVIWTGTYPSYPINRHNTEGARVSAAGEVIDAAPFEIWENGGGDEHVVGAASDGQDWAVVMTDVYVSGLATKTRLVGRTITADGTVLGAPYYLYSPSCCAFFYRTGMAYAGGTYLVVFEGYVSGSEYGIFGLRLTQGLTTMDSYPITLVQIPMQGETRYYRTPNVTSDGDTFYVAWQLYQNGASSQIYGARVTPAGTSLDGAGVPISDPTGLSLYLQPRAAWDGTQWVVGWAEGSQTRVARVDALGSVVDPGGVATGLPTDLVFDGADGGLQFAWSEARHAGAQPYDSYTATMGSDLAIGPDACISLGAPAQIQADVAYGDQGALLVYASVTSEAMRILAHPLDETGEALLSDPLELAAGPASHPAVAWDGQRYLVVWEEASVIRGVRVGVDGSVLDAPPLELMPGARPDAGGRDDGFFVGATGGPGAVGVRVAGDGTILDATPLSLGAGPASHISVLPRDLLWYAAWEQDDSPDGADISMCGIFESYVALGPSPVTTVGDGVAARRPTLAGGDTIMVVWDDDRGDDLDLYGRRNTTGLSFSDPADGIPLITAEGDQFDASVVWDGVRYVNAFADTRHRIDSTDERLSIYRGWAFAVGPLVEPAGLPLITGGTTAGDPVVAGFEDSQIYAASVFDPVAPFASYRLQVSYGGRLTAVEDTPVATRLLPPYPNPANPSVAIRFTLGRTGAAAIDVYDLRGARLRTLRASGLGAGVNEMIWNGLDDRGQAAPSGIYMYRLRADGKFDTGKLTLAR